MILRCQNNAAEQAKKLQHDVVKNTLRAALSGKGEWLAGHTDWRLPFLLKHTDQLLEATQHLCSEVHSACNPARIMTDPTLNLDPEIRAQVSSLIHDVYTQSGIVKPYLEELSSAIAKLDQARRALQKAFDSQMSLADPITHFEDAIESLDRALGNIPDGVLLP